MTEKFYNTIGEKGQELANSKKVVSRQEKLILDFFRKYPNDKFTPSQVHSLIMNTSPITSVRRAITNLTDESYLCKTDKKERGPWGKMEHKWSLKTIRMDTLF